MPEGKENKKMFILLGFILFVSIVLFGISDFAMKKT
jgi:hypothetical protein